MSRTTHRRATMLAALLATGLVTSLTVTAPASARGPANLKVTKVSTRTTRVQQFGSFKVSDTVKRSGAVPKGLTVEYYLSKDSQKSGADIPLLGLHRLPKGSGADSYRSKVSVPGVTPVGTWHVLACADPGDRLTESAESDNCRAAGKELKVTAVPELDPLDATVQLVDGK